MSERATGAGLLCAALALALGLLLGEATAQERVGDVEFSVISMPSLDARSGGGGVSHGYVEYRVRLSNRGRADRIVHLSYPPSRGRRIDEGVVVTRTVRLTGGQESLVSLYQPPTLTTDERLEVRVEGIARPGETRLASMRTYGGRSRYGQPQQAVVLLSRNVPRDFPSEAYLKKSKTSTGSGPTGPHPSPPGADDSLVLFRSEVSVAQWSPNWLGYSCFDVVVCSEREVEEMPPAVALALRRYIECGGMLVIHGRGAPAAFTEDALGEGEGGRYLGMGLVAVTGTDDWDAAYGKLIDSRVHVYLPEDRPGNLFEMLVAEATIPVRGLFLLVLLFGVAIGPVNLWLLSRYRRRIWLWWNVPAISLLTCLMVFGYSMVSEGWAGRGRTASFTLLDERCRRATTIGYVSYYNPLAPGGLRFGAETEVAILESDPRRGRHAFRGAPTGLRFADWTRDQHLASGWMKARVPAYFQVRKNEDRRERLAVQSQPDGSLKVLNALGADVERLYVADASGRVLEGRRIPAGAEQTLSVVAGAVPGEDNPSRMRSIFTQTHWLGRLQELQRATDPAALLAPGCYIAYLGRSPFIESPLAGVEPEHTAAIVYGITTMGD